MKKIVLLPAVLFLLALPARAEEAISDYTVDIRINPDASVDIMESIAYDFGAEAKHGIIRAIPYRYEARGGRYSLRLEQATVTDAAGAPVPFSQSRADGEYRLKIGDPDKAASGEQTYVIRYQVKRSINFFPEYDELYWNAIGAGWEVPVSQARVNVYLPQSAKEAGLKAECFSGPADSGRACISKRYNYSGQGMVSDIVFISDRLAPHEGLTIAAGWDKGLVKAPSFLSSAAGFARDNFILALPFLAGAFMYFAWRKQGRDPLGRQTIIAEYAPPAGLCPSEVGTIADERANRRDLSADIVHLAALGFLRIRRLGPSGRFRPADYELIRQKEPDQALPAPCREMMAALFRDQAQAKVSGLAGRFYKDLEQIRQTVYRSAVAKGYFKSNPQKIRGRYLVFAVIFLLLSWFAGPAFGPAGVVSVVVSALVIALAGLAMPSRTEKGVLAREHILGLKKYLQVAEKDRLEFHNAPEKSPRHFEALLPFAMALGVEKAWARQFEGLYSQAPSWYEDPAHGAFSPVLLAESLAGFSHSANAAMGAKPASAAGGGSGFSGGGVGGGFGGGGGRSW